MLAPSNGKRRAAEVGLQRSLRGGRPELPPPRSRSSSSMTALGGGVRAKSVGLSVGAALLAEGLLGGALRGTSLLARETAGGKTLGGRGDVAASGVVSARGAARTSRAEESSSRWCETTLKPWSSTRGVRASVSGGRGGVGSWRAALSRRRARTGWNASREEGAAGPCKTRRSSCSGGTSLPRESTSGRAPFFGGGDQADFAEGPLSGGSLDNGLRG